MEKNKITFLDGAMGTMLQAAGLKMGVAPESMNLTSPGVVIGIHRQYIAAGSEIIYTNTFGANRHKLARTAHSVIWTPSVPSSAMPHRYMVSITR